MCHGGRAARALPRSAIPCYSTSPANQGRCRICAMEVLSLGDLPEFLSCMDELKRAATLPPHQALQMAKRVEKELAELTEDGSHWNPLRHFMLEWSLQTPVLLFVSAVRGEAHRVCARRP